jgi:hypothetical protein
MKQKHMSMMSLQVIPHRTLAERRPWICITGERARVRETSHTFSRERRLWQKVKNYNQPVP